MNNYKTPILVEGTVTITPSGTQNVNIINQPVSVTPANYALRAEYDGNSLLIYFADAVSGSVTSAAVWRIRKLAYDGNGNFVSMTWPSGSTASTFIWDNRATYTYS